MCEFKDLDLFAPGIIDYDFYFETMENVGIRINEILGNRQW